MATALRIQDLLRQILEGSKDQHLSWYARLLESPTTLANLASALACAWLLSRLRLLPAIVRQRLFPQQVKALALADALFALMCCIQFIVEGYAGPHSFNPLIRLFMGIGFNTAALVELSLAFSFAFQCLRWRRMLRGLRKCLWLAWILGSLPAIFEIGSPKSTALPQVVHVSLLGACSCCTLLAYVAVLYKARTCGDTVKSRCWHRASVYLLNTVLTQVPTLVVLGLDVSKLPNWAVELAGALQGINGALNALTYFVQSRYSGAGIQEISTKECEVSFVVQFGDSEFVDEAVEEASPAEERSRSVEAQSPC